MKEWLPVLGVVLNHVHKLNVHTVKYYGNYKGYGYYATQPEKRETNTRPQQTIIAANDNK